MGHRLACMTLALWVGGALAFAEEPATTAGPPAPQPAAGQTGASAPAGAAPATSPTVLARPAAATQSAATTQPVLPASRPAKPIEDLCLDAVDVYNPVTERARFFKAAGVDSELSEQEFNTAAQQKDSFVRRFDRWPAMTLFDKNGNGTIDWFEADAYRQNFRKVVLAGYDADNNSRLTGPERDAANLALAEGRLAAGDRAPDRRFAMLLPAPQPSLPAPPVEGDVPAPAPAEGRPSLGPDALLAQQRAEAMRKYDADADGRLDQAERQKLFADQRAQLEQRRQERVRAHDADGDGQLSDAERQKLLADQLAQFGQRRQQAMGRRGAEGQPGGQPRADAEVRRDQGRISREDRMRQGLIRRFDRDGDGKLDVQEQLTADATNQQLRSFREIGERYLFDYDGDGEIAVAERLRGAMEMRDQVRRLRDRFQKLSDTDGDGTVTPEETRAFGDRIRRNWQQRVETYTREYDSDVTGQVSEEDREKVMERIRGDTQGRFAAFDADGDGKLSDEERQRMIEDFLGEVTGQRE